MDKRKAIQILTNAAAEYRNNLEGQKVLFLYGIPSEVKKQLSQKECLSAIKRYEAFFYRHNFLHLTGVRLNTSTTVSAIHFYQKCLDNRLSLNDFYFSKDGSTEQKLDVLVSMMQIKHTATMIGDFTDCGPRLFSEKAAGNICGCMGFVRDRKTNLNVPNTLLKKDIRDVISKPVQKVYIVMSKGYNEERYSIIEKQDKDTELMKCSFSEDIERILSR